MCFFVNGHEVVAGCDLEVMMNVNNALSNNYGGI